jgi:hypothetical protein
MGQEGAGGHQARVWKGTRRLGVLGRVAMTLPVDAPQEGRDDAQMEGHVAVHRPSHEPAASRRGDRDAKQHPSRSALTSRP